MTFNLDIDLEFWAIDSAHRLTKINIWPKFNKDASRGKGDIRGVNMKIMSKSHDL